MAQRDGFCAEPKTPIVSKSGYHTTESNRKTLYAYCVSLLPIPSYSPPDLRVCELESNSTPENFLLIFYRNQA